MTGVLGKQIQRQKWYVLFDKILKCISKHNNLQLSFVLNCWLIVDSNQCRRYFDLPNLMMGDFINHRQSAGTRHLIRLLAQVKFPFHSVPILRHLSVVKGEILPAGKCINIRSTAIRMYFDHILFYKL